MMFIRELLGCGLLVLVVGCGGRTGLFSLESGGMGNGGSDASAALGGSGAVGLGGGAAGASGSATAGGSARTACSGTLLLGTAPGIALPDAAGDYDTTAQIVVGDFDGDHKLDLVTTGESRGDTVVRLYRRESGLQFDAGLALNRARMPIPEGLVARDFTGDGRLDLAVASGASVLLLSQGSAGGFELTGTFPVLNQAHLIALGDVNGDQLDDLVVASSAGDSLSVLFAQPSGGFAASLNYATGFPASYGYSATPVVADLNADGYADIAITSANEGLVSVLFGDAMGPFASRADFAVGSSPQGLVAADFDGDGALDLATSNDSSVSVLHNQGAALFDLAREYPVSGVSSWLGAADFNEDGTLDLVTVGSNGIAVLPGRADGTFQDASAYPIGAVKSGAVADLDGDGHLDLIASQVGVLILLGDGHGGFVERGPDPNTGTSPVSLSVGDVNQDGRLDLVTANHDRTTTSGTGSGLSVLLGDGSGRFTSQTTPTEQKTDSVVLADFDGDGRLDALTTDTDNRAATLRRGRGDGTFDSGRPAQQLGDARALQAVDLNRDGYPDLAFADGDGLVIALDNRSGDFLVPTRHPFQGVVEGFDIADHDGDGSLDIAVATHEPDALLLYAGDGGGGFVSRSTLSLPSWPNGVASGDLNGDGSTDFAIADALGVTVLLAHPDGSYVASSLDLEIAQAYGIQVLDMNGDHVLDIVSAFRDGVAVALGFGDGTFSSPALAYQVGNSGGGVVADLNGDGVPDGAIIRYNSISPLLSGCRN